jgi:tetratricopeptide (TPR) repeat protein
MSRSTARGRGRSSGAPEASAAGPAPGASDLERGLLAQIAQDESDLAHSLSRYARYCQERRQPERAVALYHRLAHALRDGPERAHALLTLGQLSEQAGDFEAAAAAYAEGVKGDASDASVAYFQRNNLGYCLSQLGRHAEAEGFCRDAIALDATRANAHKNLGVALEGQDRLAEAVGAYLGAVAACPSDGRALEHLERLLARAPAVLEDVPGAEPRLARARRAVADAARRRAN